jgi:folate-binding protein YgfZ
MLYKFPNPTILEVSGPHATRYLTARLTNDIRFNVGQSRLAAILTPQGKTEGIFLVIKNGADSYLLVSDSGDNAEVVSALKRYIVADRVEVKDLSTTHEAFHIYERPSQLSDLVNPYECKLVGDAWAVARRRSNFLGIDIIKPKDKDLDLCKRESISELDYNIKRVEAGVVSFLPEMKDRLFLEAGLMEAISSTKGCYTGQEVVERILSHGRSPKLLRAFQCNSNSIVSGAKVLRGESPVGEVVSVFYKEQDCAVGFVSIRNDDSIAIGDLKVNSTPLLDL